jgi:hypothetical protein
LRRVETKNEKKNKTYSDHVHDRPTSKLENMKAEHHISVAIYCFQLSIRGDVLEMLIPQTFLVVENSILKFKMKA